MKNLILTLAALLTPTLSHADFPSVHGMLLFGSEKIYVSHLPMFHSPHDYQLIAELELPPAAAAAYRQSLAQHPEETVYTLVPETLVLPDLVAHPHPFHADLFRGHFERGGTVIAESLTVTLKNVLVWKKFVKGAEKPAAPSYYLFGTKTEAFLAHVIVAKPDFDQVLSAGANDAAADGRALELESAQTLTAPGKATLTGKDGASVPVEPKKELYLETGDLSH